MSASPPHSAASAAVPPSAKSLTPRQRERRERILHATRQLVGKHGYDGMVMRDVAARAGVSATTLYNLYHTKDELLLEALRDQQQLAARRAFEEAGGPGLDLMLRHLHHVARQSRESPAYVDAITRALLNAGPGDVLVEMLMDRLRRMLVISLQTMRGRHQLRIETDLEELAIALTGAFWSAFMLWNKGLVSLQALERTLLRNYLALLLPALRGQPRKELAEKLSSLG